MGDDKGVTAYSSVSYTHLDVYKRQVLTLIKKKFLETAMLHHPNFEQPFYLNCDASDVSLGAELYQDDKEGHHLVISFASRLSLIHI